MNSLPMKDDNDRLLEGTLPHDPFADAEPLVPAEPETATADDPATTASVETVANAKRFMSCLLPRAHSDC